MVGPGRMRISIDVAAKASQMLKSILKMPFKMAIKKFALTVDTELAEAEARFTANGKSPTNEKPDESDAEDWTRWLVLLLMPEGKRFDGLLVTQISSGGKIWIISSWLSGDGSYQAFVARLSKP